jgi:hypothetical protein
MELPIRQRLSTAALRMEQPAPYDEEVGKCGRDLESVQILRHAPVTDFLGAKDPFDHADGVLHFSPNPRFVAVPRLLSNKKTSLCIEKTFHHRSSSIEIFTVT